MRKIISLLSIIFILSSCSAGKGSGKLNETFMGNLKVSVSAVKISNQEITLSGKGLDQISSLQVQRPGKSPVDIQLGMKSDGQLSGVVKENLALVAGEVFSLLIGSANGSSVVDAVFTIADKSISATAIKGVIGSGGIEGDTIVWDSTSHVWKTSPLSTQTYLGLLDASLSGGDVATNPRIGDFYYVSKSGVRDFNGAGAISYTIGDKIIFNGESWDLVKGNTGVTSFNGRTGTVNPAIGDYSWQMLSKVPGTTNKILGSSLGNILGVDLSVAPIQGDSLVFDGTNWVSKKIDPSVSVSGVTGLEAALQSKEDKISSGAIDQYYTGDKEWRTLDTKAVKENTLGGMYFTDDRARTAVSSLLIPYAKTSDLSTYATNSSLLPYAKTSDLSAYVKQNDLSVYATNSSLSAYAKTSDLSSLATSTSLDSYEKISAFPNDVRSVAVGVLEPINKALVVATDTIVTAIGKLQSQISSISDLIVPDNTKADKKNTTQDISARKISLGTDSFTPKASIFTINDATVSGITPDTGQTQVDNVLLQDQYSGTYETNNGIVLRSSRGGASSPLPVLSGDNLGFFGARGNISSSAPATYPSKNTGVLFFGATESWNSGAWGTKAVISVTPSGSTSRTNAMVINGTIDGGGSVKISGTNGNFGSDDGARLDVNGSAVTRTFFISNLVNNTTIDLTKSNSVAIIGEQNCTSLNANYNLKIAEGGTYTLAFQDSCSYTPTFSFIKAENGSAITSIRSTKVLGARNSSKHLILSVSRVGDFVYVASAEI